MDDRLLLHGEVREDADFSGCVFSGSLTKVVFNGTPVNDERLGRSVNEFRGNDFTGARLRDVAFRRGIDLDLQRAAGGRDAPDRARRAGGAGPRPGEGRAAAGARAAARREPGLSGLENTCGSGQRDLFVDTALLGREPETRRRLIDLLTRP